MKGKSSETQSRFSGVKSKTLPSGALLRRPLAAHALSAAVLYSATVMAQWKYTIPYNTQNGVLNDNRYVGRLVRGFVTIATV